MKRLLKYSGYIAAIAGVGIIALLLEPIRGEVHKGVGTPLLLLVVLIATRWGTGPALVCSVFSGLYFNVFYMQPDAPIFPLQLIEGEDFYAMLGFVVCSVAVGQLSARAERRRKEIETLYEQLRSTVEEVSRMEAARRAEKMKSVLLDVVTHDLRTPLTAIKAGATALMEMGDASRAGGREKELLSVIIRQSDRLNRFIEGMLELAKLEAGSNEGEDSRQSIGEVIEAATARAEELLSQCRVEVECQDEEAPVSSPRAIAQVLYLVIENAARYSPAGGRVMIASRVEGNNLSISVEDEGPGIPVEARDRVFEKWYRHAPNAGGSGLGLGLTIARGIVEAQQGKIVIEDPVRSNLGTRVVISLPTPVGTAEPATQSLIIG